MMIEWLVNLPWSTVGPYVFIGGEWLTRVVLFLVVVRRHRSGEAVSWLLVIFLQPFVGLGFYLLLTTGPIRRKRLRQHAVLAGREETGAVLAGLGVHAIGAGEIAAEHMDFVRLAERVGRMPIVGGNAVSFCGDGGEMIEELVRAIDGAGSSVHLLYYIFEDDETGATVTRALERAAGRGVQCRVLVDAVGSPKFLRRVAPRLRRAGVETAAALAVKPITRPLARMDVRNHRKLAVIDGRVAVTGSHNISDEDYGQKKVGPWRDLSMVVRGPAVRELQMVFVEDWQFETGRSIDRGVAFPELVGAGDALLQAVPSGPGQRTQAFRDLMVSAVHEANERVVVTTPYFVPDGAFLLALRLAAMGGLEVHLVVPERGNHPIVHAAGCATYEGLLEAGVRIHRHRRGVMHAKTITIDDAFGVVGSGNFDMRSFSVNFELSVLVFGAELTSRLHQFQVGYMGESRELDKGIWALRGAGLRVVQDSAKLLGPLL